MERIELFDVLRRHALLIVMVCVTATVAAYALCLLIPNQYTASALVLVRPQQPIKMGTNKDTKEFLDFPMASASVIETASKTYIEIIKSTALLGEVVRQIGLDKEKENAPHRLPAFLRNVPGLLMYGGVMENDPFSNAVKELRSSLKLETHADTYLFDISYPAKDPQRAADVANTTAKTLVKFVDELRLSEARYQRDHLKTELDQRQQQVNAARDHLESYKKAHSVFLYDAEYEAKLKVLSELQVDLVKAETALVGNQGTPLNASLVAKRASLLRAIGQQQAELAPAPGIERELKQLEDDVKDALTAYEALDKEVQEADIKLSYGMPEVRLVSEASAPRLPSSPLRGTISLVSLIAGLIVGVGFAFFREYLNRGVRSIHDIEDFIGVRVIATIPRMFRRQRRHAGLL